MVTLCTSTPRVGVPGMVGCKGSPTPKMPPFALTPRRLARAERGVLRALEYQTFVSPEAFGASLALAFGLPEVAVPEPLKRLNTA